MSASICTDVTSYMIYDHYRHTVHYMHELLLHTLATV